MTHLGHKIRTNRINQNKTQLGIILVSFHAILDPHVLMLQSKNTRQAAAISNPNESSSPCHNPVMCSFHLAVCTASERQSRKEKRENDASIHRNRIVCLVTVLVALPLWLGRQYSRPCRFRAYTTSSDVTVFRLACSVYVTASRITPSRKVFRTPRVSS